MTIESERRLHRASARADFSPLLGDVRIVVDDRLDVPFRVSEDGSAVALAPGANDDRVVAFHLRHAAELRLWCSAHGRDPVSRAVAALAACRVASLWLDLLRRADRVAVRAALPRWLAEAFERSLEPLPPEQEWTDGASMASRVRDLLRLQVAAPAAADLRAVHAKYTSAIHMAAPLEHFVTTGGDPRITLDPETGLSPSYGCSPRPRACAADLASSTASSISPRGWRAAEQARQVLIRRAAAGHRAAYDEEASAIRADLLRVLELDASSGVRAVLMPSGTHAELFALWFCLHPLEAEVVNLLVAPDETGNGVATIAGGRHFADRAPSGAAVEAGMPVAGFPVERIELRTVGIRDARGRERAPSEISVDIEECVKEVATHGRRLLLHVIDSSKTGWGGPSPKMAAQLREQYAPFVDVLVDACQLRISNASLRSYLDQGFMVLVTGSKFFTGPAFAGAVLIPGDLAARVESMGTPPAGFADYSFRSAWPSEWHALRAGMPTEANLGLLLRWRAALEEMRAFNAVPVHQRRGVLTRFATAVTRAIRDNPSLCWVDAMLMDRAPGDEWEGVRTIFTFSPMRRDADGRLRPTSDEENRAIHSWLNADISSLLPPEATEPERRLAAGIHHVGQPLCCGSGAGSGTSALRISSSARIVLAAVEDGVDADGAGPGVQRRVDEALRTFDKLGVILKYLGVLRDSRCVDSVAVD